ncbi:MAG: ATP-binding protein [Anaerolineales bacterium]|jgi:uncharacterized protein
MNPPRRLVDRSKELKEMDGLLEAPRAQLAGVTGRRRLGKTTLLEHWAAQSGLPTLFWGATQKLAPLQLKAFSQSIYHHEHGRRAPGDAFSYPDWDAAFIDLARICTGEQRHIIILDEFPYAIAADKSIPSVLQYVWDHHLKDSNLVMILCGSHIGMMNELFDANAPLYKRLLGPMKVAPLPFQCVADFLPGYSFEERTTAFAAFGGVPAYLEQLSPDQPIMENLMHHMFSSWGIFNTEPTRLIGEQVSELSTYNSILSAVANGARKPAEISRTAGLKASVNPAYYLDKLCEMDYIRNDYSLTIPPQSRAQSRQSHYRINDQMLQFYFQFVEKNRSILEQEFEGTFEERMQEQLASFIGKNAFEEICREWLRSQGQAGDAPFPFEDAGRIWGTANRKAVEVDVAAISWRHRALLLGEAKWTENNVGIEVLDKLLGWTTERVLELLPPPQKEWTIYHYLFAKRGFTPEVIRIARENNVTLVQTAPIEDELVIL